MFTSKHNRTHKSVLSAALVGTALGLGLASGSTLAMDIGHNSKAAEPQIRTAEASQRVVVTQHARGGLLIEQPGNRATAYLDAENYIGGRVGRLPRHDDLPEPDGGGGQLVPQPDAAR